jgi:hypothetical protein
MRKGQNDTETSLKVSQWCSMGQFDVNGSKDDNSINGSRSIKYNNKEERQKCRKYVTINFSIFSGLIINSSNNC